MAVREIFYQLLILSRAHIACPDYLSCTNVGLVVDPFVHVDGVVGAVVNYGKVESSATLKLTQHAGALRIFRAE